MANDKAMAGMTTDKVSNSADYMKGTANNPETKGWPTPVTSQSGMEPTSPHTGGGNSDGGYNKS